VVGWLVCLFVFFLVGEVEGPGMMNSYSSWFISF
jgi:hypothetical protein